MTYLPATHSETLPANIEDVAKFLLVAPEKVKYIKAEIQAIKNLGFAKEVYEQKLEEQRRLSELILDASVKIGEFTRGLPKAAPGVKPKLTDTVVAQLKPKQESVRDLGFSPKQVERFETLADNADIVEQVKAEARESGAMPTRTRVLDLASERKRREEVQLKSDLAQIDRDFDNLKKFNRALANPELFGILDDADNLLPSVVEASTLSDVLEDIDRYVHVLTIIKGKLISLKGGKRNEPK